MNFKRGSAIHLIISLGALAYLFGTFYFLSLGKLDVGFMSFCFFAFFSHKLLE